MYVQLILKLLFSFLGHFLTHFMVYLSRLRWYNVFQHSPVIHPSDFWMRYFFEIPLKGTDIIPTFQVCFWEPELFFGHLEDVPFNMVDLSMDWRCQTRWASVYQPQDKPHVVLFHEFFPCANAWSCKISKGLEPRYHSRYRPLFLRPLPSIDMAGVSFRSSDVARCYELPASTVILIEMQAAFTKMPFQHEWSNAGAGYWTTYWGRVMLQRVRVDTFDTVCLLIFLSLMGRTEF